VSRQLNTQHPRRISGREIKNGQNGSAHRCESSAEHNAPEEFQVEMIKNSPAKMAQWVVSWTLNTPEEFQVERLRMAKMAQWVVSWTHNAAEEFQ
jgi:hypothetical protein